MSEKIDVRTHLLCPKCGAKIYNVIGVFWEEYSLLPKRTKRGTAYCRCGALLKIVNVGTTKLGLMEVC